MIRHTDTACFAQRHLIRALRGRPVAVAVATLMSTSGVFAQALHTFSIPPGPLSTVLSSAAATAGVLLSADAKLTQGIDSPGVRGRFTSEDALARALTGTGLMVVPGQGGGFTLRAIPAVVPSPAGTTVTPGASKTLSEVRVTAEAESNDGTTEGTGRYTAAGPSGLATGLNLSLRETPQSVTVFTRQRMDDFKLETLSDVLEQTPGVTVDRQNETTRFNIRGSTANQQIDGMRQLSDGWAVTGHTLYTLDDMAEIDRIEVLKGSSGLINGDGYYGGTINLVRKRPTRDFQAHVEGGFGSGSSLRGEVDLSGPLNADASLRGRLVVSDRQSDGFRDNQSNHSKLIYGTAEYDLAPNTLLSAGLTYRERGFRGSGVTHAYPGLLRGW